LSRRSRFRVHPDTSASRKEALGVGAEYGQLFFDTTSTYFERDTEDDPSDTGEAGFRRYGHSKDHRDDLPRIVIGLAVTKEGIPVRCWCWPGNTSDQAIPPEVKDDMRGWPLGRVVTVVDRGFSSADNLAYLRRAGGHFIAGMRMRDHNPLVEQVTGPPRPLPAGQGQPAGQGSPHREHRRAVRDLP
jgi:hypothetical protein